MQRIEVLFESDFRTETFLALLREAAGQSDAELRRLVGEVLPEMKTIGIRRDDTLVAFAAFNHAADGNTLEYLAVDDSLRGQGRGTALVRFIRGLYPALPLVAETDDDAVDFYRRLGFTIEPAPCDQRWPDRRRYRCTLPPFNAA